MNPQARKNSSSGFTLLEMLVVLALLSLLMVVLTGTTFLGISARHRVSAVAADQQDFGSFHRILVEELGAAYPQWVATDQTGGVDFSGMPQNLGFLGPALEAEGQGLAYYKIFLAQQHGKQAIRLEVNYDEEPDAPNLVTDFAVGLATLKIEYFGRTPDGGAPIWQDRWIMRTTLPDLIAIEVTFPTGDRRSWPMLMIHPEVDADVTCEIDPSTHLCLGR